MISYSGDAGFLKIHIVHFSVTFSGHRHLVFQGNLILFGPVPRHFNRLPVIQGNSCPAFPIVISPFA
jgi:hypothetical protein